jgi:hypothetical protein
MSRAHYSVTEVALAARCPRQLVLARAGHRAGLAGEGSRAVGAAAHALAQQLFVAARGAAQLPALLEAGVDAEPALRAALYALVLPALHDAAVDLAPGVWTRELVRLDGVVRSLVALVAALFVRAHRAGVPAHRVAARVLVDAEREVRIELPNAEIVGRVDLLCEDVSAGRLWLWELKTFAPDGDPASAEQARLYGLATGGEPAPAVLHVTGDRLEMVHVGRARWEDLGARVDAMTAWLSGAETPPKAAEAGLCERCTVQGACWARWGRTLFAPEEARPGQVSLDKASHDKASRDKVSLQEVSLHEVAPGTPPSVSVAPPPLWLGAGREGAPVTLPPSLLPRHMALFGATGSGKTWLAKVILEEAILAGIPALVFDTQGDLAQLSDPTSEPLLPALAARRDRFFELAEVRVFTPASDAGRRLSLSPLFVPSGHLSKEKVILAAEASALAIAELCDLPPRARRSATIPLTEALVRASKAARALDFEALADDLAEEEAGLSKAERESLVRAVRRLQRGKNALLYAAGSSLDPAELTRPERPGRVPLHVVYLNTLPTLEAKQSLVAALLGRVYSWMLATRPAGEGARLLVMMDEVGPYMPPSAKPASKEILTRLFKEGRKYGVAGLFCTQSFTDVDYKVLGQAHTKAIGRLGATQDQRRAEELVPGAARHFARLSPGKGRFVLDAPEGLERSPTYFQVRPLLTAHGPPFTEEDIARRRPPGL